MTDSLFVSLCKRGCPYFHTGSLVHRWQVVFGSALLHRVHFGSWRGWLHRDDFDIFRHYCTYIMIPPQAMQTDLLSAFLIICICTAFGEVDWYTYYVSLHVCIPPLAMMTGHFPFYLLSHIPRYAILIFLHVVIPLSYPCKIILFIVFAIICSLLWWLMCYFPMIILNTAPQILGSSQLVSELWLTLVPRSNTLNTSSE